MLKIFRNNKVKKVTLFFYDFISLILTYICMNLIIYPVSNFKDVFISNISFGIISIVFTILLYAIFKLYNCLWKYASINEVIRIIVTCAIVCALNIVIGMFNGIEVEPKGPITFMLIQLVFAMIPRFGYKIFKYFKHNSFSFSKTDGKNRAMIVGAGDAGVNLIREMQISDVLNLVPVCIIDDDKNKINTHINNVPVVGARDDIPYYACKYDVDIIIIAIPSITSSDLQAIINICKDTKCKIKLIPGTVASIKGASLSSHVRDVEVSDLLGRREIQLNTDEIASYIDGKVVMVTGGSGSIGSELCRQIALHSPKMLIIFEINENTTYELELELRRKHPKLNLVVLIGSVRDKGKLEEVFKTYNIDIVFHAAAHKHVPLMENSPNEAIKNNVFGTLNCCEMADKYNVKKFILISTDKAVNPTNVMGASKRICEMIVQSMQHKSKNTKYVAVRFGNVLGSNGSVIPLFKKQIENGGPVTITDFKITRYFMTIPEAVGLVLQAGAYASGGEIFVLDMGKPVKIYDLAVNLIKLSGYSPNVDIKIEEIGLRPGEKLYEELLMDEEGLEKTQNNLIYIGKPLQINEEEFFKELDDLYKKAYSECDDMKEIIEHIVPTYHITNNDH